MQRVEKYDYFNVVTSV